MYDQSDPKAVIVLVCLSIRPSSTCAAVECPHYFAREKHGGKKEKERKLPPSHSFMSMVGQIIISTIAHK